MAVIFALSAAGWSAVALREEKCERKTWAISPDVAVGCCFLACFCGHGQMQLLACWLCGLSGVAGCLPLQSCVGCRHVRTPADIGCGLALALARSALKCCLCLLPPPSSAATCACVRKTKEDLYKGCVDLKIWLLNIIGPQLVTRAVRSGSQILLATGKSPPLVG